MVAVAWRSIDGRFGALGGRVPKCLHVPSRRDRAAGETDMEPLPVLSATVARPGSDDEARRIASRWGGGAERAFMAMAMNNSEPRV